MSTHLIPGTAPDPAAHVEQGPLGPIDRDAKRRRDIARKVMDLCLTYLRDPEALTEVPAGWQLTFTPDLSAAEAAALGQLFKLARSTSAITPAELESIAPDIATMRAFRQRNQSDFMALTANQRDRELYDVANAHTRILLALLRD